MYMLSSTYHRTRCFILLVLVAIRFAAGNHTVTHTIATPCQSGANSRSLLGATITTATSSSTSKVGANRDEYDGLVSTPSRVFGPTRKQAVLSPRKFDLSLFRVEQFREWLHNTTVTGGLSPLTTPPISQPCTVVVNHRLRYIYIRTRKTASSTVVRALEAAGACPGGRKRGDASCHARLTLKDLPPSFSTNAQQGSAPLSPNFEPDVESILASIWSNYTVFTSTRNPWARAASAYDFLPSQWGIQTGGCARPPFPAFTADPNVLGRISNMMGCCLDARTRSVRRGCSLRSEGVNFWSFDFAHVEPAFHCLYEQAPTMHRLKPTTLLADSSSQPTPNREEGNGSIQTKNWLPVFDFALRYEHLEDDMASLFGFLNARRPMGQPPLAELKQLPWEKKGTSISKSAAFASSSSSSRSASFPAAASGAGVRKGATSSHAAADDADGGGGSGGGQEGSSGNRTGGGGDGTDESASSSTRRLAQSAGRRDGGRDDSAISSSKGHPHGTAIQDCMHAAHGNAGSIHTLHAQRRMHVTSSNASAPAALFSHAEKYRACGAPCVCNIAKFASEDIRLLGWDVLHAH